MKPIGATTPPRGIAEAVGAYIVARGQRERELGMRLDHQLEHQVRGALVGHGLVAQK